MSTNTGIENSVKLAVCVAAACLAAAWAGPVTVSDNFNRTPGDALGANWNDPARLFNIGDPAGKAVNRLSNPATAPYATYTGVDVGTGAFSVQANLSSTNAEQYVGLCFNVIDANNYYCLRVKPASWGYTQVLKYENGIQDLMMASFYTDWASGGLVTVSYDGLGKYTMSLGAAVQSSAVFTPLTGGGVGLYYVDVSAGQGGWENFSATYDAVPEPAAVGLLGLAGVWLATRRKK